MWNFSQPQNTRALLSNVVDNVYVVYTTFLGKQTAKYNNNTKNRVILGMCAPIKTSNTSNVFPFQPFSSSWQYIEYYFYPMPSCVTRVRSRYT